MTLVDIFRRDIRRLRRSKTVWIGLAVFFVFTLLTANQTASAYLSEGVTTNERPFTDFYIVYNLLTHLFGTVLGVGITYAAIARDRETGNIQHLLCLPNGRRDLLFGRWLSRCVVVGTSVSLSVLIGTAVMLVRVGSLEVELFVTLAGLVTLYVLVWVGIGISASVLAKTQQKAGIYGGFMLFVLNIWWLFLPARPPDLLANALGVLGVPVPSAVRDLLWTLSPGAAMEISYKLVRVYTTFAEGKDVPGEVGLAVLVLWVFLPLVVAYVRFARADLS